jgi:hypothetical protein
MMILGNYCVASMIAKLLIGKKKVLDRCTHRYGASLLAGRDVDRAFGASITHAYAPGIDLPRAGGGREERKVAMPLLQRGPQQGA